MIAGNVIFQNGRTSKCRHADAL